MAINTDIRAQIAFKNLLGKSITDNNKLISNEAEGIFINAAAEAVFLKAIDPDPATAINNGLAEEVVADLVEDTSSNGHAFFAQYPSGHPNAGERVRNAISPSYDTNLTGAYIAEPIDTNGDPIPLADPRDWIYQYQSGIFYQDNPISPDPETVKVWVYIGDTLSDLDVDSLVYDYQITQGGSIWRDPVEGIINTPPNSPTDGERWIVGNSPTGDFSGRTDQIAVYDANDSEWDFTVPQDNYTLRIKDDNDRLYYYISSIPAWVADKTLQIRFLDFAANSLDVYETTVTPDLNLEDEILILAKFDSNNSNTNVDVNINNANDNIDLKKYDQNGSIIELESDDIISGVIYFLIWDTTNGEFILQQLGSAGGTSIGNARDGNYDDGLFSFTDNTKVGHAVDDINEVLSALAPPPAPDFSEISINQNGVVGNLSFDSSNSISGYNPADGSLSNTNFSVDETFGNSFPLNGIIDANTSLTGVLNDQVTQGSGSPNPAYPADAFGNADQSVLQLFLNDNKIDEIDLTNTSAIDSTSGGSTSGFNVTATDNVSFPNGDDLNIFVYRTGTWRVNSSDLNNGYNKIEIVHDTFSNSSVIEFIVDDNTTATTFGSSSINNESFSNIRYLSGIAYFRSGTLDYSVTVSNMYRNTWYDGNDALTFNDNSGLIALETDSIPNSNGDEAADVTISNRTLNFNGNIRSLNSSVTVETEAKRTVQSVQTGGGAQLSGLLIDDINSSSDADSLEDFNDETYRIPSGSYNVTTDVDNASWDSQESLIDGGSNYTDGLQVIDGKLVYPGSNSSVPSDFQTSNITNAPSFNDGGTKGSGRDYNTASGNRTYVRYFQQVSPTTANFVINISGNNVNFVSTNTTLSGNDVHLRIKLPSETGWMDAYKDFTTGNTADGDGARNESLGAGRALDTDWGLTVGTKNTANSDGYILVEITTSVNFTGEITEIDFTFD